MIEPIENEMIFIFDPSSLFQDSPNDSGSRMNPDPGFGGRAFMCDRYEECLDSAACNEWAGFHCESCFYAGRGFISFYWKEFIDLDPEEDYPEIDLNKLKRASTMPH